MPVPVVEFSDERLPNGLRLIVAEDHLAPVVAVNLWYNVGSKHEVPGKTGFAHLFEHVMFQGSAHVGKAEHMALVQGAGGTLNGTTWLDRTNYFETLPSHQLELAIWLEADRMGSLLEALSQENLDNQREVVKNEKRWSYDNRPYGTRNEKLLGHLFPERGAERRGRLRPGDRAGARGSVLRADPGQPGHSAAAGHVAARDHRHRDP
jgi:zinc protease